MYKMCPGRIVNNKLSKLTADTSSSVVQEYIADETDHQILIQCILLTIQCCFGKCKPPKLMFKLLPKSKYSSKMPNFLSEHTLIIYVQFILGSKRKNFTPLREIVRERF